MKRDHLTRRDLLAAAGVALPGAIALFAAAGASAEDAKTGTDTRKLKLPESGTIDVAFLISPNANVIDTTSPWEVFQDTVVESEGRQRCPFRLFTVARKKELIRMTAGLEIMPRYSFDDAPQPHVIVVPAQSGSAETRDWLVKNSGKADVVMSVCTGAFVLGGAGLLDGKSATTHHDAYETFAKKFPNVTLCRGKRFVDNGQVATAGGLTSGFDMALHVVSRYLGQDVAAQTARFMEYDHYDPASGLVVDPPDSNK